MWLCECRTLTFFLLFSRPFRWQWSSAAFTAILGLLCSELRLQVLLAVIGMAKTAKCPQNYFVFRCEGKRNFVVVICKRCSGKCRKVKQFIFCNVFAIIDKNYFFKLIKMDKIEQTKITCLKNNLNLFFCYLISIVLLIS